MSWISMFTLVMRSNVTALREQIEDPERVLHQLLIDMQSELDSVRNCVAESVADEIQMRRKIEREREDIAKWERRAREALERDDERTARAAIDQKMNCSERLDSLVAQHNRLSIEVEKLKSSVRDLEDKIRQAQQKKSLLVARLARAKSVERIHTAMDRTQRTSALAQFQSLERKVDRQEAKIQAWEELDDAGLAPSELEVEFLARERKAQIETELISLKGKLE